MCKCQEPKVEQRLKMQEPTVEITVPQSAERSQALDNIMGLTQDGSSTGQKLQKAFNKMEKLEKKLTRRPVKIHMLGQEGCQEFQLNEQTFEEQVKKANEKNKKSREAKKQKKAPTAGIEVLQNLDEAPAKENGEQLKLGEEVAWKVRFDNVLEGNMERQDRPYSREEILALEQARFYTPEEIETMVEKAKDFSFPYHQQSEPTQTGSAGVLPSFEEMMVDELFNGPSSMETQPYLEQVLEEGNVVINGCTVEQNPEKMQLNEYLMEETKPLHTNFVLPDQRLSLCYTCPVYFGSFENKQKVLEALCNEIHSKVLNKWGMFSCHCGLVPNLKLSQTPRNKNKVFLGCPKKLEVRCNFFQWIHEAPKPAYVPKTATRSALKKRLNDMVSEKMSIQKRQKTEGGFQFP